MITFSQQGNFSKFNKWLEKMAEGFDLGVLDRYGREGVQALSSATPVDSSLTANSWYYTIERKDGRITLSFGNKNIQNGIPIAIILQYGHGTGTGGWVEGRDYINPAIQPIFDKIAENAWREVTKS